MKNRTLISTLGTTIIFLISGFNLLSQNDIALSKPNIQFLRSDSTGLVSSGFYSMLPLSQAMPIIFGAEIKNMGTAAQTNVKLSTLVTDQNGTVVFEQHDSAASLGAGDTVMIMHPDTFTPTSIGDLSISMWCSQNEQDQNPDNNTIDDQTIDINNKETIARHTAYNSAISNHNIPNFQAGDMVGYSFFMPNTDTLKSFSILIDDSSDIGTMFYALIYDITTNLPTIVCEIDEVYITNQNKGTWIESPFVSIIPNDLLLTTGHRYLIGIEYYFATGQTLAISSDSSQIHDFPSTAFVRTDTNYQDLNKMPLININFVHHASPLFSMDTPLLCGSATSMVSFTFSSYINNPTSYPLSIEAITLPPFVVDTSISSNYVGIAFETMPNDLLNGPYLFHFRIGNGIIEEDIRFYKYVTESSICDSYLEHPIVPWDFEITDSIHQIEIPVSANPGFIDTGYHQGDYIGVFSDSTNVQSCAGYAEWTGNPLILKVYGATNSTQGFTGGNKMHLKLWKPGSSTIDLRAYYDQSYPDQEFFATTGSSRIDSLFSYTNNMDKNEEQHITVFPNPTQDQFYIEMNKDKVIETLLLFSIEGKQINLETTKSGNTYAIGTQHLPPGVYFLKIELDDEIITRKVVKK